MRNKENFLACEDIAGGSDLSAVGTFFMKYRGPSGGSQLSGGGIIILRVQSTADGCRSLTTLTRPHREHHGGGRRRGLGRERHGGREDSAVVSDTKEYKGLLVRLSSPENNSMCGTEGE